jgi:hypothetical protein
LSTVVVPFEASAKYLQLQAPACIVTRRRRTGATPTSDQVRAGRFQPRRFRMSRSLIYAGCGNEPRKKNVRNAVAYRGIATEHPGFSSPWFRPPASISRNALTLLCAVTSSHDPISQYFLQSFIFPFRFPYACSPIPRNSFESGGGPSRFASPPRTVCHNGNQSSLFTYFWLAFR